jgi:hypothetical protein
MDAAFKLAALDKPHRALGITLQPLTLGHLFLLEQHDSAFVSNDRIPTADDLILSCFICSDRADRFTKNLRAIWTKLFLKLWSRRAAKLDLLREIANFRAYLRAHEVTPEICAPVGAVRALRSPHSWRLLAMCMNDFNMSEAEALAMPILKVNCLWVTEADRRGTIELWGDDRQKLWEHARAADAKRETN